MNDSSAPAEPKDQRVQVALGEYLERIDCGEAVDRKEFLSRHAEIADQLRSFIAAEDEVRKLAGAEDSLDRTHDSMKSFAGHGASAVHFVAPTSASTTCLGLTASSVSELLFYDLAGLRIGNQSGIRDLQPTVAILEHRFRSVSEGQRDVAKWSAGIKVKCLHDSSSFCSDCCRRTSAACDDDDQIEHGSAGWNALQRGGLAAEIAPILGQGIHAPFT
jgi:hypothetical protein